MNDDQKIASLIVAGLAAATVTTYSAIRIHKEENKKRKEIRKNALRELEALAFAAGVVHERIGNGCYDGKTGNDMLNDMEFETIAYLNK